MRTIVLALVALYGFFGWSDSPKIETQPDIPVKIQIETPYPILTEILGNGGHGVGNGGDFVRARFIKIGFEIIDYLTNHEEGVAFTKTYNINVYAFSSVLNTHVVLPTDEKPTDNRGQKVDAIFKNGNLYLYVPTWEKFLSSRDEMYFMVFHEMLRVTGHFDDSYVISRNLEIPADLELSDEPPKFSNHIICVCSAESSRQVNLLCVESSTQKTLIDVKFKGEYTDQQDRRFEQCEKQRKNVLNHFGLPDEKDDEPEWDTWISGSNGQQGGGRGLGAYKVDVTFQVKGYSEKFGIRCSEFWGYYYMVSANGAYWEVAPRICEGLKSALLVATEANPVKVLFKKDFIINYEFNF